MRAERWADTIGIIIGGSGAGPDTSATGGADATVPWLLLL